MIHSAPESVEASGERGSGAILKIGRRILLINVFACAVIAFFLWWFVPAFSNFRFLDVLAHSEVIGMLTCGLIILFRHVFEGINSWWRWLQFLVYPLIVVFSYVAGTAIARFLIGVPFSAEEVLGGSGALVSFATTLIAAVLGTLFFVTREKLSQLKLRAAQEEQRAVTAQLAMLRAQIEPHMLFNTLANLRALITVDPDLALVMLDRLNDFLRATLNSSNQLSNKLSQEFGILENYLELMKIRLGARLTYSIDLPASLGPVSVPSLLLQPVVENAIKHGIEPSVNGGHISIAAALINDGAGDELRLTVIDTGIGMATDSPAGNLARDCSVPDGSETASGGFGLYSLRERLDLRTQHKAQVFVDSPPAQMASGTQVVIRIPQ